MSDVAHRAATAADAEALTELWAAAERVDDTGEHYSLGDLEEELANPLIDLAHDWLVVEEGGELVASSQLSPRAPADGAVAVTIEGVVRPGHRGRGIGSALLPVMVRRARAYVAEQGSDLRPILRGQARSEDEAATSLLESHGFVPQRWSFGMECDLSTWSAPLVELPSSYDVSTWVGAGHGELRTTHNVAFADHPGFTPWSAAMWGQYVSGSRSLRPELSLIARDEDGTLAAYVEVVEFDGTAEVTGVREAFVAKLGTVPDHRRRGLGAALLGRVLLAARDAGYGRSALDVDSENDTGAARVYERAGFEVTRRFTLYEMP